MQDAARKSVNEMNTAKRMYEKTELKGKVIGKLQVVIGANRKGEIVIREGDNLTQIAKGFSASYGLIKKDVVPKIT